MARSQKIDKTPINMIDVNIKLDSLVLDSHPIDTKADRKTKLRVIKLNYIQSGGLIKAPIHLWMFGWLKEVFKSKAAKTLVYLENNIPAYTLGSAKDILVGRTKEVWELEGDKTVEYKLGEELEPYNLYPFHNYVPTTKGRSGSVVKYFYKVNAKTAPVKLFIYSDINTDTLISNMRNLGKIYGIGAKANGYRLGTFTVGEHKVVQVGEMIS